jgi:hypothetical protein
VLRGFFLKEMYVKEARALACSKYFMYDGYIVLESKYFMYDGYIVLESFSFGSVYWGNILLILHKSILH